MAENIKRAGRKRVYHFTSQDIESCPRLRPPYLAILRLSLTENYPGMAKALDIKLGTVRSRLNRARKALVNALKENEANQ